MRKVAYVIPWPFLGKGGPRVWRESTRRQLPHCHVQSGTENVAGVMPGAGGLGWWPRWEWGHEGTDAPCPSAPTLQAPAPRSESTLSCAQDGDKFWRMPECYIRGSTIKYLRIPDEIIDMVKEEVVAKGRGRGGLQQQKQQKGRGMGGAGRGRPFSPSSPPAG